MSDWRSSFRHQGENAASLKIEQSFESGSPPVMPTTTRDTPQCSPDGVSLTRRGMLKSASIGGLSLAALTHAPLEDQVAHASQLVNRSSKPSDLRITDLRIAEIRGAPMRVPIIRIDTNQGITGYGEVRDGGSPYALCSRVVSWARTPAMSNACSGGSNSLVPTAGREAVSAAWRWPSWILPARPTRSPYTRCSAVGSATGSASMPIRRFRGPRRVRPPD